MRLKKILGLASLGFLSVALLTACSSDKNSDTKTAEEKVTKVTVAQTADSKPYTYKDGDTLTGFDIEVLKAIDKALVGYEFDYKVVEAQSILTDIDAGRAKIGADNFGKTPEREEKYLFTYPISQNVNAIFSSTKNNFKSIGDLVGKTTEIPTGTNYGAIFEAWNKANPDKKIDVKYSERPLADRLAAVEAGQIDFLFASASAAGNLAKEHKLTVASNVPDLTDYPTFATFEYFIIDDQSVALQKAIDQEIKKLAEDGTLKKLSEEFYGADFVPAANEYK
ncbi:amino acid ABC transporter substrate-binding protein [Lactococcus hodotermopsidis]|uniref:Amino acid ABC transporter substrate-binding protein n=1 Tax=Pseudolactococcus hodotermopsidis TaxID=2709157 RepID=A0A6A0BD51_9LACT|nr:transporter substrate-binding domain-containing protein [Lactococcus hodotermopsidis]GFH42623.1 amino acid ABC transporter substrate-binding protein [Lactococcus hodotermopsidis]